MNDKIEIKMLNNIIAHSIAKVANVNVVFSRSKFKNDIGDDDLTKYDWNGI